MTKIAGSGSISQRPGSADPDPDPLQNVMDPQHCFGYSTEIQWSGTVGSLILAVDYLACKYCIRATSDS
jgi:hypothetical protein